MVWKKLSLERKQQKVLVGCSQLNQTSEEKFKYVVLHSQSSKKEHEKDWKIYIEITVCFFKVKYEALTQTKIFLETNQY